VCASSPLPGGSSIIVTVTSWFSPAAAMLRPLSTRFCTSFRQSKFRMVVIPCFLNSRACRSMMSRLYDSSPTTLMPRERVWRLASGPAASRKASIMSNAFSLQ
jgi:hypothetical protein